MEWTDGEKCPVLPDGNGGHGDQTCLEPIHFMFKQKHNDIWNQFLHESK